jgi:uncharacterized RDD family membrane protein YckC
MASSSDPLSIFGQDTFARDWARDRVAKVDLNAAQPPANATDAPTRADSEDALHSRLNAAVLDQLFIGLISGGIVEALGVKVLSPRFFVLAAVLQLSYFFVQEWASGQTIGKRRCGVRVVKLDGSAPGPGAIAVRTLGRLLDALPAYQASGLLTMMGTGRRHRQRIGDYLARTTVVATVGGRALAPRRAWLLPLLTLLATLASVAVIVELARANSAPSAMQASIVRGCEDSGGTPERCGCVYNALASAGYTTVADWQVLDNRVLAAESADNAGLLPAGYVAAVRRCQTS